ncbi:MAG: S8 family serine peptidase [Kordia sp.]|uniref:S8 family peptidase n=1 Tax=Kordia sp. TaxID=1965332 RepID=UPI0038594215
MKKKSLFFIGILFTFFSCTIPEDTNVHANNTKKIPSEISKNNVTPAVVASFSDSPESEIVPLNEIIIEYELGVSEIEKQTLRTNYGVVNYRACDCTNGNNKYELWTMQAGINIEPTVKVIKRRDREKVSRATQNKEYEMKMHAVAITLEGETDEAEEVYIESSFNDDYLNRLVNSNDGITIAVLDTGIDTDQAGFAPNFLYNSTINSNCGEESGWDFVNNSSNTYDDDIKKHGTVVSYVIHKELAGIDVNHQILPVKIADFDGTSTFFNTLCGLQYAIQKDADVINMSFGWETTNTDIYMMFSDLIDTTDGIIVTSAGNKDQDNDTKPHYPSNFTQNHVIAVAAANTSLSDVTSYSNYGRNSVDFYAIGNNIMFPLRTSNTFVKFKGTSFAAPFVSAKVAELLANNLRDVRPQLRQQFGSRVNYSKAVFYMELIE